MSCNKNRLNPSGPHAQGNLPQYPLTYLDDPPDGNLTGQRTPRAPRRKATSPPSTPTTQRPNRQTRTDGGHRTVPLQQEYRVVDIDSEMEDEESFNTSYSREERELSFEESMEHLHTALDRAIDFTANLPPHTAYPPEIQEMVGELYALIVEEHPRPSMNAENSIVSMLEKLTRDVEELKRRPTPNGTPTPPPNNHANTPKSQATTTVHATGPLIRPQPKNKTLEARTAATQARRTNNPMTRHHPARLIIQPTEPIVPERRRSDRKTIDAINTSLKGITNATVVAIKWNDKGNCIVIAHPSFTAEDLLPHEGVIGAALLGDSTREFTAVPDKKWHRILLNGVDTGKADLDTDDVMEMDQFEGRQGQGIQHELKAVNPCLANVNFTENPRWLTRPEILRQKMHSTVILTVSSQEEVEYLMTHVGGVFMFGRYATFSRYQDTKPIRQCLGCWSFDHHTSQCRTEPSCRVCAGPHHESAHSCEECPQTAKAQKGCSHHSVRCTNCGETHVADHKSCTYRKAIMASTRTAHITSKGGRRVKDSQNATQLVIAQ